MSILIRGLLVVAAAVAWAACGEQQAKSDPPPEAKQFDADAVLSLLELVLDPDTGNVDSAKQCLGVIAGKIQSREVSAKELAALAPKLDKLLAGVLAGKADDPLYLDAALLASSWKNPAALAAVRRTVEDARQETAARTAALNALAAAGDDALLPLVEKMLGDRQANSAAWRAIILQSLGRLEGLQVADVVLGSYAKLEADLQPKAIELLTERPAWSKALLDQIAAKKIPATAISTTQVRKLLGSSDRALVAAVKEKWGSVREGRDPKREQVIAEMRKLLQGHLGDAPRGQLVFARICGQCHKIYGQGADVGPDLTSNGRASFEQILSNVFDPSLVIGASYQAVNVRTVDGRVVSGLPIENGDQRVVLKVQGGKIETIARDDIDELQTSKLSLMPEGLETQIKPDELRDLFAFLVLDKPPAGSQGAANSPAADSPAAADKSPAGRRSP
jgi:putative heme-binding domain-containing protein